MLDKLEIKGLVKRSAKENDRRAYLITITPEGKKLRDLLLKMGDAVMNKALNGLTEKQTKELSNMLQLIYENLKSTK
jgi:DNA-binding MarR family transcriptional regulator